MAYKEQDPITIRIITSAIDWYELWAAIGTLEIFLVEQKAHDNRIGKMENFTVGWHVNINYDFDNHVNNHNKIEESIERKNEQKTFLW